MTKLLKYRHAFVTSLRAFTKPYSNGHGTRVDCFHQLHLVIFFFVHRSLINAYSIDPDDLFVDIASKVSKCGLKIRGSLPLYILQANRPIDLWVAPSVRQGLMFGMSVKRNGLQDVNVFAWRKEQEPNLSLCLIQWFPYARNVYHCGLCEIRAR